MKCPKCHYLGYETGDRCRNCGYDFSLLAPEGAEPRFADVPMRPDPIQDLDGRLDDGATTPWPELDLDLHAAPSQPRGEAHAVAAPAVIGAAPKVSLTASGSSEQGLPLFALGTTADEEPPIPVPTAPRKPVAVRRAPEIPRRPAVRPARTSDVETKFPFPDHAAPVAPVETPVRSRNLVIPPRSTASIEAPLEPCEPRPRVTAAVIDLVLLAAIDLLVVYLTLHVATLTMGDWRRLPAVPLTIFLALITVGYFAAFAAIGGQTIGKMAARIRVVTDAGGSLTPGRAIQRSLSGILAFLTLGAAFAPALIGRRRAVHDVVSGTRVVAQPLLSGSHPLAGDVASMAASSGDAN